MNEDENIPDEERGLYPKYRAFKIDEDGFMYLDDGSDPNPIPDEVTEPFMLLKFNDPHAMVALLAYANSCEDQYPKLAEDIRMKVHEIQLENLKDSLMGNQGKSVDDKIIDVKLTYESPNEWWACENSDCSHDEFRARIGDTPQVCPLCNTRSETRAK